MATDKPVGMYCLNGTEIGIDDDNTNSAVQPLYQVCRPLRYGTSSRTHKMNPEVKQDGLVDASFQQCEFFESFVPFTTYADLLPIVR